MPVAPPISDATLAMLQALEEASMKDGVEIHTPGTRTMLPSGGWRHTSPVTVTTKGKIGPLSTDEVEKYQADRTQGVVLERLKVPKDTAVSSAGTVTVTSARHGTTRNYTIEGVTPLGTYSVSRVLIVKAVG